MYVARFRETHGFRSIACNVGVIAGYTGGAEPPYANEKSCVFFPKMSYTTSRCQRLPDIFNLMGRGCVYVIGITQL